MRAAYSGSDIGQQTGHGLGDRRAAIDLRHRVLPPNRLWQVNIALTRSVVRPLTTQGLTMLREGSAARRLCGPRRLSINRGGGVAHRVASKIRLTKARLMGTVEVALGRKGTVHAQSRKLP